MSILPSAPSPARLSGKAIGWSGFFFGGGGLGRAFLRRTGSRLPDLAVSVTGPLSVSSLP